MKMRLFRQLLAVIIVMLSIGSANAADDKNKSQLKDKTVQVLMRFAFSLMPSVYTGPDGKKISIDKEKQSEVLIPIDDARRIVIVGNRSAKAQNCDLKVMQTLNHNAMVKYEEIFKKWTTKQKLFINQLHLFTVLYLTGNVKVQETSEAKKDVEARKEKKQNADLASKYKCSEEERKQVAASIDAYLDEVKNAIALELARRKKTGASEKKNDRVKKAAK